MAFVSNLLRCCWLMLALLWATACVRTTDFEVETGPPKLVINTHFAPGEPWRVHVSRTVGLDATQSERDRSSIIDDALVEILDAGTPVAIARFEREFWPGTTIVRREEYVSNYPVQPGGQYGIRVSAQDLAPAQGEDEVPAPASAPTMAVVGVGINPGIRARVTIQDTDPEPNYFHLIFLIRAVGDTTRGNPVPIYQDPFNPSQVTTSDAGGVPLLPVGEWSGLLLDDKNFTEDQRVLSVDLGQSFQSFEDERNKLEIRTELRAVSKAYYDYHLSATRHYQVQGNAFAEPVRIFNNVTGGLGNVSGYVAAYSPWVVVR